MKSSYRYVVIGVGGIGSAATYWLSQRGLGSDVLALERFGLDHERGASRDRGRVIRYFYHRPEYVQMAPAGFAAWADVERAMGVQLVHMTGGVTLHPPGTVVPPDDYITALDACGVGYQVIDGAEVRRRWPQFRIDDDVVGVIQDDTGIVRADLANDTHVAGARANGATVLADTLVRDIVPVGDGYTVHTDEETYRCERVILAADAWTNDLLAPLGHRINLTVTEEQVAYYETSDRFSIGQLPVWVWLDTETYYGLPSFADVPAKVSMDSGGPPVHPDERTFRRNEEYLQRTETFLCKVLPDLPGRLLSTKTCLYTMPPDRDFVIDRIAEHPGIVVCQGAAHAYKFASLIGRIAADLATDRTPEVNISAFSLDRPSLYEADPSFELLLRRSDGSR